MGSERPERPVFCGNFEYEAEERDIARLFEKYGRVERIDMKTGFAFVYMRRKSDGDEAIRKLDRSEYGYKRRPLRVEWAKNKEADMKRDTRPSKTLFVVNFDVRRTSERDIERYFARYGRLSRVQIKKNYAFVQFPDIESAIRALERTNGAQMEGRTLTVEYVQNEDPNFRLDDFRDRDRSRSRSRDRGGRGGRGRSPSRSPPRYDRRPSPPRGGRSRSRSPPRGGGGYERRASPPRVGRSPSRSPVRRASPPRGGRSPSRSPPRAERRASPPPRERSRSRSPEERKPDRSPSYDR
ncbi:hypothetical protein Agub_g4829 [Astrephomene gubernaculifera]|uniref:RRM domain-containing protein n=1 Tax=Astrephomene gubernaculifera TaxID=47775 RepID=A0AAD3DNA3_9CHLO|nr:hypothetical protein Agub_g4829 [Astrephomene gubernaculifera]